MKYSVYDVVVDILSFSNRRYSERIIPSSSHLQQMDGDAGYAVVKPLKQKAASVAFFDELKSSDRLHRGKQRRRRRKRKGENGDCLALHSRA